MVEKTILVKESDIMKFGLSISQGCNQGETLVSPKFPDTNNNPIANKGGEGRGELCPTTKALSNLNTVCLPLTLSEPRGGAESAPPPGIDHLLCLEKCRYELQTS